MKFKKTPELSIAKNTGPQYETCESCNTELIYPPLKGELKDPRLNRIVGRSAHEGYLCRNCVPNERDWRNDVADAFYRTHEQAEWGSMIRIAKDLPPKHRADAASKAEVSEFIGVLKKMISQGITKSLPYDPTIREHHVSRGASIARAVREAEDV